MKQNFTLAFFCCCLVAFGQTTTSWRFYRPGNTGIQGDSATALWIDHDGNPYIAANTGGWGEGGFAKYDASHDQWTNFSNVDLPVLGGFDNGDIHINDIIQDANGVVWMAKNTGIIKFNPEVGSASIESFTAADYPLLGYASDVDYAPDGTLWLASQGLIRYNPQNDTWDNMGGAQPYVSVQPKSAGSYLVWSGDAYFGQVSKFDSATNTTTYANPVSVGDIAGLPGKDCVDDDGNFWALRLAADGAFETLEYQDQNGVWHHPVHPYSNVTFYIDAFKAFGSKQALLVTATGEVWRFDGTNWQNYGIWRDGSNNTAVDIDAAGNVWVCGLQGAARRDAATGNWQRYRLTNTSQIDYFVEDLCVTPDAVWFTGNAGTGVGGIQAFDGDRWKSHNPYTYGLGQDFPFLADNATAICYRPSNHSVAFSPTFSGIYAWDDTQYSTLDGDLVTAKGLVEDAAGKLWQLGEYYHIRYYDQGQWTLLPIVGWGRKIMADPTSTGGIWAMTDDEIQHTDANNTHSFTLADFDAASGVFTGLAIDSSGNLWTGNWLPSASNGSVLIKHNINTGQTTTWSYDEGWPFPGEHVRPMAITPDGKVWMQYDAEFPSLESGLLSFDGTNVTVFPSAPGGEPAWNMLPNSNIKDLEVKIIDGGYELWMSCLGRGIAVLKVLTENLGTNPVTANTSQGLSVFPNPASGSTTLHFSASAGENCEISLYDLAGRLVKTLSHEATMGMQTVTLDLTATVPFQTGLYLLKITKPSGMLTSKIMVKP